MAALKTVRSCGIQTLQSKRWIDMLSIAFSLLHTLMELTVRTADVASGVKHSDVSNALAMCQLNVLPRTFVLWLSKYQHDQISSFSLDRNPHGSQCRRLPARLVRSRVYDRDVRDVQRHSCPIRCCTRYAAAILGVSWVAVRAGDISDGMAMMPNMLLTKRADTPIERQRGNLAICCQVYYDYLVWC